MKRFIFFSLSLLLFSQVVYADVSRFAFTTDPQSIAVNATSSIITVQSQNPSGLPENIIETNDILFTSTSPTGQFFSTSGLPVSATMSKNTANKNFLYEDSSVGTYTITVKATGRTSLNVFTASQQIVVGSSGSTESSTGSSTSDTLPQNNSSDSSSNPQVSFSAHSSPASLSSPEIATNFEISSGRNMLTSVGSEVLFKAIVTKISNIPLQSIIYEWSFGDGTVGKGDAVSHFYKFPGDYAVVLNAFYSDKQAVARSLVRVVSPEVLLSRVVGGLQIENKSGSEINLGGWSLVSDKKVFIFPKDTLIPSHKIIIFADEVTSNLFGTVQLQNPIKQVFGSILVGDSLLPTPTTVADTPNHSLTDIQNKINQLKETLSKISPPLQKDVQKNVAVSVATSSGANLAKANPNQEASAIKIFEAKPQSGFVSALFSWPIKGFNFIHNLFIEH